MRKTMLAAVALLALLAGAPKFAHASYDGTPSTGSFSIVDNTKLAAASASGTLTVLDTSTLLNTIVTVGAYQFKAGRDFAIGASTNATATNLAAAINASPVARSVTASAVAGDNSVSLAAVSPGALYNSIGLRTSASGEITVSGATMTGGQDSVSVSVNGVKLLHGADWFLADVSSNTAISLAFAIKNSPRLSRLVDAQAVSSTVFLRSLATPAAYPLATSSSAGVSVSQSAMSGGAQGLLTAGGPACFLGTVAALPDNNYPAGCLLYLSSDPTKIYVSTKTLTGAESGSAYWLAK